MKDHYPPDSTIPPRCLVPPELQPDYLELPGRVLPAGANIGRSLSDEHVAAGRGDMVAAIHAESGRSYTYLDLAEESTRLAVGLVAWGIKPGDRIALRSENVPEVLLAAIAAWKAGAVVVPTPVQARADELQFFLRDTGARMLVIVGGAAAAEGVAMVEGTDVESVWALGAAGEETALAPATALPGYADPATALPEISADSVAVLWHTGGTTGQPKGCYHTHRRYLLGGYAIGEAVGTSRGERWAAAAPVGHALGFIYHTIFTVLHGATVLFIEDFRDPHRIVDAIDAHRVDTFAAIMATWARMLDVVTDSPDAVSSVRRGYAMWQTASSSQVRSGWNARGLELMNNFGSTAFATWPLVPRQAESFPPASLGKPLPGYEVVAVARDGDGVRPVEGIGQLAVRGVTGLTYWNRPDLQQRDVRDGWTLSDDLVEFDETGNAAYLGRTDYMISTAGYKVAPVEVESALGSHPAVREVAVIGAPDALRQEIVVAFVALAAGADAGDELVRELQELVKTELSPYKYPRRVHFVRELPRDSVGKVQGKVLKAWALGDEEPARPEAAVAAHTPNAGGATP
jgi:2-aminobenzoate-CoA ligase